MPQKDFGLETLASGDVNTYLMQQAVIRCTSSTRPSSPTEGWHIYETDTRKFLVYRSGSWVREGEFETYAVKTIDQNNSSGTYTDDPQLFLPLALNQKYWFDGIMMFSGTISGYNVICTWSVPTGTTMNYASNHPVIDDPGTISSVGNSINKRMFGASDTINIRTTAGGGVGSFPNAIYATRFRGTLNTGSTLGNLQFRWRANSGTVTLHELSCMRLQMIG